jgi:hypothetical protein
MTVETAAYTSADLAVSSTYYLRGQIVSGVLSIYVQKGTDADPIPASLRGTPGGASGGGFDSTVLDILFGKIVTGVAGSLATITPLANAASLTSTSEASGLAYLSDAPSFLYAYDVSSTLNWARVPVNTVLRGDIAHIGAALLHGGANKLSVTSATRYAVADRVFTDWNDVANTPTGRLNIQCFA